MVTGSGSAFPKKFSGNYEGLSIYFGREAEGIRRVFKNGPLRWTLTESSAVVAVPHAAAQTGRQSAPVIFGLPGRKNFSGFLRTYCDFDCGSNSSPAPTTLSVCDSCIESIEGL